MKGSTAFPSTKNKETHINCEKLELQCEKLKLDTTYSTISNHSKEIAFQKCNFQTKMQNYKSARALHKMRFFSTTSCMPLKFKRRDVMLDKLSSIPLQHEFNSFNPNKTFTNFSAENRFLKINKLLYSLVKSVKAYPSKKRQLVMNVLSSQFIKNCFHLRNINSASVDQFIEFVESGLFTGNNTGIDKSHFCKGNDFYNSYAKIKDNSLRVCTPQNKLLFPFTKPNSQCGLCTPKRLYRNLNSPYNVSYNDKKCLVKSQCSEDNPINIEIKTPISEKKKQIIQKFKDRLGSADECKVSLIRKNKLLLENVMFERAKCRELRSAGRGNMCA